jgi:hypothetical protein
MSSIEMTAVLHHSTATGTSKLVLMGIAYHMGKDGLNGCWPSQGTLAEYANVSVRQVQRSIQHLVELGELEVEVRGSWTKGSLAQTNVYFIPELCPDWCDGTLNHRRSVTTFKAVGDDIHDRWSRHG